MFQVIRNRFDIEKNVKIHSQSFDPEWEEFVDLEDVGQLKEKTKLKCITSADQDGLQASSSVPDPPSGLSAPCASGQSPQHPSTDERSLSWPIVFVISEDFLPKQVKLALERKEDLAKPKNRHVRGLFLGAVCDCASKYTAYPDMVQKHQMAKAIVTQWPHLKEEWGRGYDGWLSCLINKLKNSRRCQTLKRKHTSIDTPSNGDTQMDSPKRSRVVPKNLNLDPAVLDGEDETSLQIMKEAMKKEMQKIEALRDKNKLSDLLKRSYTFRRQDVNASASVESIKRDYPALFTPDGFTTEYELLTGGTNIRNVVNSAIIANGKKILKLAEELAKKSASNGRTPTSKIKKISEILNTMDLAANEQDSFKDAAKSQAYHETVAGMLLLPIILEGDERHIFREYSVS